jgi:hypothetical protein
MSNIKLYELEEQIMKCWGVTDDLKVLLESVEHDDRQSNILIGLIDLYDMKFEKLFKIYEQILTENNKSRVN